MRDGFKVDVTGAGGTCVGRTSGIGFQRSGRVEWFASAVLNEAVLPLRLQSLNRLALRGLCRFTSDDSTLDDDWLDLGPTAGRLMKAEASRFADAALALERSRSPVELTCKLTCRTHRLVSTA